MSDFNNYSEATQRKVFALKSNIDLVKLWVNAQATVRIYEYNHDIGGERWYRATKAIELCEYTLSRRGLCMTLNGDFWTDGPIPAPPKKDTQSELLF